MQRVSSSSAVYKETTTGSKLSRGKSLDPKSIQMLEQEAFLVIAANNKKAKSADSSSFDPSSSSSFSMENYKSADELKAKKQKSSSYSCCRAQPVVPRRETAQSAYSIEHNCKELLPPPEDPSKISLILDLDETLIHSSFVPIQNSNFTFLLNAVPAQIPVSVLIRPHAEEFITSLGEKFELIIFTASNKDYADYCIDQIDPKHLIKHKLYRESCSDLNGATVKDLGLLNRNLKKLVIIDNSPMSYLLHPYNAIPITTWMDDPNDTELMQIATELLQHADADDVYSFLVQKDS